MNTRMNELSHELLAVCEQWCKAEAELGERIPNLSDAVDHLRTILEIELGLIEEPKRHEGSCRRCGKPIGQGIMDVCDGCVVGEVDEVFSRR
jgi:hypothetical protein